MQQYWADLLMAIADGSPAGVADLKAMPVNEFYYYYKTWKKRMEHMTAAFKKK